MFYLAFCMTVSSRVLSRICLYWLPRYLLHLRLKSMNETSSYPAEEARRYLHELVFRVQDMDPEAARNSVSVRGLTLLSQNQSTRRSNLLIDSRSKDMQNKQTPEEADEMSLSDFFPAATSDYRGRDRRMISQSLI